jgi:hypothetical protein
MVEADRLREQLFGRLVPLSGDRDQQRPARAVVMHAQLLCDGVAAHLGHFDVEDDRVEAVQARDAQHIASAVDAAHLVALVLQQHRHGQHRIAIVVGDQDARFGGAFGGEVRVHRCCLLAPMLGSARAPVCHEPAILL